MPSRSELIGALGVDAIYDYPLKAGLIVHVTLSVQQNLLQPGDMFAAISICEDQAATFRPLYGLAEGYLTMYTPLHWEGNLTIETPMRLVIRILTSSPGTITTNWSSLLPGNIKQIGEYNRAVVIPTT